MRGDKPLLTLEKPVYRIRPMDMVRVEITIQKDGRREVMPGEYRVSADGHIPLMYLNQVQVAGLTLPEAAEKIKRAYIDQGYFKKPEVILQISSYAERRVYIDGFVAVAGPVNMPMEEELTLVRAITAARGLQPRASRTDLILIRNVNGEEKKYIINLKEIQEGNAPDILLQEGDKIYVQDSKI
ncbi:polysaccharide biosynthesis/export family protein [Candidatus Spyradosoma sp. SGI.093]|uniref:polysaccharide biosynthesis/export family protein n=1 Tax=Candidatus Spyradosoma sp. SGI.093 TaxID=3420583 RepID=UPI003CFF7F41